MDGSKQGDSSVRYIFSLLGVKSTFKSRQPGVPTTVVLRKSGHRVSRVEDDFVNAPDLAQTIVATCCALNIPFRFTGLQTLKIKETNRINALKTELGKLGYVIRDVDGRELVWDGTTTSQLPNSSTPSIDTYNDHRMALAFAPLSLLRPITINDPLVVTKSYPHFWDDLHKAGFSVDNS
jgi:3-phosphoshikimate 1-carboxyvinyltransferase